jgi:hypothetical protein
VLVRPVRDLSPTLKPKFGKNVGDMVHRRAMTDRKRVCHLLVGQPAHQQEEHVDLSPGEPRSGNCFRRSDISGPGQVLAQNLCLGKRPLPPKRIAGISGGLEVGRALGVFTHDNGGAAADDGGGAGSNGK